MRILKIILVSLTFGTLLTAATMLFPYDYCMDGPGRGFPCAVLRPWHGASAGAVRLQRDGELGRELALSSVAVDVLVWSIVAGFVWPFVGRFRKHLRKFRQRPENAV